jgi:methionine-rich copper-binding protein CopC
MALFTHDPETVRKYLLGQLTDDQQESFEQRLLTEDELTQELEVITQELVDEYLAKQLTPAESEWFEQHYLASPEGKRSQSFATTFHRYVSNNPTESKKTGWAERLAAFWNRQALPARAIAAMAVVVIVVGIFWLVRTPSPQSFATLTLTNNPITRSGGGELPRIRLKEDALRIDLMLEAPATSGLRYRAELKDGSGQARTLEPIKQDARSVSVELPASWLPKGHYAINLLAVSSDNTAQRVPGSYQFIIE